MLASVSELRKVPLHDLGVSVKSHRVQGRVRCVHTRVYDLILLLQLRRFSPDIIQLIFHGGI